MQFTSIPYLAALALATVVYFALPRQSWRTVWLLAASYAFYFSLSARWTVALAAITLVGYAFGLLVERARAHAPAPDAPGVPLRTKRLLAAGIALVAGTLFVFKYTAFAADMLNRGLAAGGFDARLPLLSLALPVGISFWTFLSISYLVDVARGQLPAERNVLRYALFVGFFPHVTAGPIARGGQLLPQLAERHTFDHERMRSALLLILWGCFKKLLVADPLGLLVGQIYNRPHANGSNGVLFAAATVAFAIQLYCDFSGYTDIVRGSARLFGVELLRNFDRPYEARSVKEFWRRWHMTLMGWLKDYVYIPLGGSRRGRLARYRNILAVFLLSGLWHGAGLKFVAWGLLNGVYQIAGEWLQPARDRTASAFGLKPDGIIRRAAGVVSTFALICSTWVFFRAPSLSDALFMMRRMVTAADFGFLATGHLPFHSPLSRPQLAVVALAIVVVFAVEHVASRIDLPGLVYRQPLPVRWALYQGAILAVVVFGHYGQLYSASDFAYFKF